jgi:sugar O-acyltransferase (sialic acid O-acetyltransferase NeuD family)
MKTIAIFGAGGHTKVIIDLILELNQYTIVGIYDDNKEGSFEDIPIIGKINGNVNINYDEYIIGIGNDNIRKKIYKQFLNLRWAVLIHPRSIVSKSTMIDNGTVVFAGAVIQTGVKIGKQCIINTNCNIDHETIIRDFSSICPGVTICGNVSIGELTFIGANSTIIQGKIIGEKCMVGAGTVVIRNVDDNSKIVGNPVRIM